MASETIAEAETRPSTEDMEVENPQTNETLNGDANSKREREEEEEEEEVENENGDVLKKQKVEEKSVEEERMEKVQDEERENGDGEVVAEEKKGPVSLGPKTFETSVEMFDYFYKLLHHWATNVCVNKYEYLVLLELIKQGHPEPEKKIGSGIKTFEIRHHPIWKSRCFFVVRADESVEDFSFRKCVDQILPLPENMKIKSDVNKALGGNGGNGRKGGGGGRGGGRGRGGRGRGGRGRR